MKATEIKQVFKEIIIDENQPGSVLRDFESFLQFVTDNDLDAAGKNEILPMKCLAELNLCLTKPFTVLAQRPMQKTFANINGLFLLARASGLLLVKKDGKKKKLEIYQEALNSWQNLNPTEKYLTLVEILITRVSLEMIGEREGMMDNSLYVMNDLMRRMDKSTLKSAEDNFFRDSGLRYYGAHNFALGEMFGWIEIKSRTDEKGWIIEELKVTDFGKALIAFLGEWWATFEYHWENALDEGEANPSIFNYLQPILQPIFPQWQNVFRLPDVVIREGIFVFKVSLDTKTWRKIAISSDDLLDDLHDIIQDAFDFDNDHLYQFTFRDRFGKKVRVVHPMCEDEEFFTDEFRIKNLPLKIGDKMIYLFDFGDHWQFEVELEEIQSPNPKFKKAKVLESKGKAPEQYPSWDDDDDDDDE